MNITIEARNMAIGIVDGRIIDDASACDMVLRIPDGDLHPGLINAHDHLHRNHYGRLGRPPYEDAYKWGRDIHEHDQPAIAKGRSLPRRDALLFGAWKNLLAGVTTVVHHDAWEDSFDDGFPIRVVRVRHAHSLGFTPDLAHVHGAGPFFIHVAEGVNQRAAHEIRMLEDSGFLNEKLCAVHVVGADREGVQLIRDAGAAVVWCPSSNIFLFGRTAPAGLLAPGIDVMLGSDSLLTGQGNLLDEMRVARETRLIEDERLLQSVAEVPARRLRLPAPSLAAGSPADVIVLRTPLGSATAEDVALVICDGQLRVLDPDLVPQLGAHAELGTHLRAFGVDRWVHQPSTLPRKTVHARLA